MREIRTSGLMSGDGKRARLCVSTRAHPRLYLCRRFAFRTLYCFFATEHHRRRILHLNVTFHPTSDWIVQQLREAFPLPCPYRYVLFDHDAKFGNDVLNLLRSSHLKPLRTSTGSAPRMERRNVGSAACVESCSTMLFR